MKLSEISANIKPRTKILVRGFRCPGALISN